MSLTDRAISDLKRFISNSDEFGVPITLTAPDTTVLIVDGWQTLHHTSFNEFGERNNTKIASVAISLEELVDNNYPHIISGEADFNNHLVTVKGKDYVVSEFYPDELLRVVILILSEWQA